MSDVPRRNTLDGLTAAERAIHDAIMAVESLPADVRLTDAGGLLKQAFEVADFTDGVPIVTRHNPRPGTGTPHRWNPAKGVWEFYVESWGGWLVLRTAPGNATPPMTYDEGVHHLARCRGCPIMLYEEPAPAPMVKTPRKRRARA